MYRKLDVFLMETFNLEGLLDAHKDPPKNSAAGFETIDAERSAQAFAFILLIGGGLGGALPPQQKKLIWGVWGGFAPQQNWGSLGGRSPPSKKTSYGGLGGLCPPSKDIKIALKIALKFD